MGSLLLLQPRLRIALNVLRVFLRPKTAQHHAFGVLQDNTAHHQEVHHVDCADRASFKVGIVRSGQRLTVLTNASCVEGVLFRPTMEHLRVTCVVLAGTRQAQVQLRVMNAHLDLCRLL